MTYNIYLRKWLRMLNKLVQMFDGEFALFIAIEERWHGKQTYSMTPYDDKMKCDWHRTIHPF